MLSATDQQSKSGMPTLTSNSASTSIAAGGAVRAFSTDKGVESSGEDAATTMTIAATTTPTKFSHARGSSGFHTPVHGDQELQEDEDDDDDSRRDEEDDMEDEDLLIALDDDDDEILELDML